MSLHAVPGKQTYSTFGGKVENQIGVLTAGVGGPRFLSVQFDFLGKKRFAMGIRGDLYSNWGGIGFGGRLPMRLHLFTAKRFSMAFGIDPGIELLFNNAYLVSTVPAIFSIVAEPALPMGIKITDYLTILTGISVPISINITDQPWVNVSIDAHLGAEFAILDNLVLYARGQGGPRFNDTYTPFYGHGMAGVQWKVGKTK